MQKYYIRVLSQKSMELVNLKNEFQRYSFEQKSYLMSQEIKILKEKFSAKISQIIQEKDRKISYFGENLSFICKQNILKKEQVLESIRNLFASKNPTLGLNESYAQVVKDGKTIKPKFLKIDDIFELQSKSTLIKSKVLDVKKI